MPELPEVETIRRGVAPHVTHAVVQRVIVRERRLRWPISADLETALTGQTIQTVERRAKYLLLRAERGTVLLHLGMSGRLRILQAATPANKHDHVDIDLHNGTILRFTDPRRFGAMLWTSAPPEHHPLLRDLGPEPLEAGFTGAYLHERAQGRTMPVKSFIMDGHVVVGVGNIYANEALFLASIGPLRPAGRIAYARHAALAEAIRAVLADAIQRGGTTLRDFVGGDGEPGYFQQQLQVYDRADLPCRRCGGPIQRKVLSQRATYFCPRCQR
ncbi:MAG: bifunctional DNA-formamidopyrimidine glycosylase/DNA-(apurinic or apyrimidinic site) lyase [Gammaproteobacteria bacterium]